MFSRISLLRSCSYLAPGHWYSNAMMWICILLLLVTQCQGVGDATYAPACALQCSEQQGMYKDGDIIIGGILQRSLFNFQNKQDFRKFHDPWTCQQASLRYMRQYMAFFFAIEEINRNPEILPNFTLGYHIADSCASAMKALQSTLSILSKTTEPVPNYSCQRKSTLVGFIGEISSAITLTVAELLRIYKYPQISYGAGNPVFSDKGRFPSFYRTVPNELEHYRGIAALLRHFGWSWVGILTSYDESGEKALWELKKALSDSGGCIAFSYTIPTDLSETGAKKFFTVVENIRTSTAQVILLHSSGLSAGMYFLIEGWDTVPQKIWIATLPTTFFSDYGLRKTLITLNGTLRFSTRKGDIIGFREFLYKVNPLQFPDDVTLNNLWQTTFKCKLVRKYHLADFAVPNAPFCSGNETLQSLDKTLLDVSTFRFTYSVYIAVYALAHALNAMHSSHIRPGTSAGVWNQEHKHWKLNSFLRKVHFKTAAGDEIGFDDKGDLPSKFEILNWVYLPNKTSKSFEVGSFDPSAPPGHQLTIKESSIVWPYDAPSITKIPRSVCSESCHPGFRKVPIEGKPICCFRCVPCSDGEFSNSTDMENCLQCPEDQWSNEKKDGCTQKITEYLSYGHSLGVSLASLAVVFSISTALVLGIFLRHKDTPIVKANNRGISYVLLISLMLAFLCSLFFIGRPVAWTCLIQQAAFGIIFTVAVSCVLAKTITVVIAFNATKPGSRLSRWLGLRVSGSMVLLCTLGEVVICLSWLLTSPPHPHTDMVSETGKIILLCDAGSITFFYCVIGYMGLLAFVSFSVAFLARNLPDRFNEAQLITFSMLVFCSVWVSFIPAYLSTKGRCMVAVEIFAILASSAGLLACIFLPKCYIIMLRPDLNAREQMSVTVKMDM